MVVAEVWRCRLVVSRCYWRRVSYDISLIRQQTRKFTEENLSALVLREASFVIIALLWFGKKVRLHVAYAGL